MLSKKNHVGRPSNKEISAKKKKEVFIFMLSGVFVLLIIGLLGTGALNNLMGNSVTNYYCDSDYTLRNDKCFKTLKEKAYGIGDVNRDDEININDVTAMQKYFSGAKNFNDYQLIIADVNSDGKFNVTDETILRKYISGISGGSNTAVHYIGRKTCPKDYKLTNNECIKEESVAAKIKESANSNKIIYGDVNSDGKVNGADSGYLTRYAAGMAGYKLNDVQMQAADVNSDGKVDTTDSTILANHVSGWKQYSELPIKNLTYGDVNSDGKVNAADSGYLTRYVAGMAGYKLNDVQMLAADVNLDGKVDSKDRIILSRYVSGWEDYKVLPYTGIVTEDK